MEIPINIRIDGAWTKKILRMAIPAGFVLMGGVALAGPPKTFAAGEPLKAADLNANFSALDANFSALDGRLVTVEATPAKLVASSSDGELSPGNGQDTIYTHAELKLPAGTWLVQGYANLSISGNADTTGLGLYDATNAAPIPDSVGSLQSLLVGMAADRSFVTAQTVLTVAMPTAIRLEAVRNGASGVVFVNYTGSPIAAIGPHKLVAVKLR